MNDITPGPIPVALALLDQQWPPVPALTACPGAQTQKQLATDPRYLVGRFQQAINVLLSDPPPPADHLTNLLTQALADAITWRLNRTPCPDCHDELCPACNGHWDQADRYHELARALGATGTQPSLTETHRSQLTRPTRRDHFASHTAHSRACDDENGFPDTAL
jgi:hypothetical protein